MSNINGNGKVLPENRGTRKPKRVYSQEEKNEVIAALAAGETTRNVARRMDIPLGTVNAIATHRTAIAVIAPDEREVVRAKIKAYADACIKTLLSQVELLGERDYLENHGSDIFALSQSNRIIGEQVARFIAALYGESQGEEYDNR